MLKGISTAILSMLLLTGSAIAQAPRTAQTLAPRSQRPVSFFENKGQAPRDVLWEARGSGFEVLFFRDSFVLRELTAKAGPEVLEQRISLAAANTETRIEALDILSGKFSFFRGRDPHGWVGGLTTYGRLRYKDIYPGIDLLFYGNHGKLEYDFVVAAGADPGRIRLRVDGAKRVTERGELELGEGAQVTLHRPLLYQSIASGKKMIEGRFVSLADGQLGFECGRYNREKTLVIDPTVNLLYATYLGGVHDDEAYAVALDSQNNSYILGKSASQDYPISGNAYQSARTNIGTYTYNTVLTKMSPTGTLLFSTFIGDGTDIPWNPPLMAVDSQGNAWIAGVTASTTYPVTANAYQGTFPAPANQGGTNLSPFFSEISPDGSSLLYSTYFAGPTGPYYTVVGVAVNGSGHIYLAGTADSGLPTTPGAYLPAITAGNSSNFVAVFDPTQTGSAQLLASSYFGVPASQYITVTGMALDTSGNPWVVAHTNQTELPTTANAIQPNGDFSSPVFCGEGLQRGLSDGGYVAKLSADLTTLLYGSYLTGGQGDYIGSGPNNDTGCDESISAAATDANGNLYMVGYTGSDMFPITPGAYQTFAQDVASVAPGSNLRFVAKLSSDGSQLVFSTFLGAAGGVSGFDFLAVDGQQNTWIASNGLLPVTGDALQSSRLYNQTDGAVAEISGDGTTLLYGTYLPQSQSPGPCYQANGFHGSTTACTSTIGGFAVDQESNAYIAGTIAGAMVPVTANAFQGQFANGDSGPDGGDIFFMILGGGTISAVGPLVGGNTGDTTITINGAGIQQGATCSLVQGGTTIQASAMTIAANGTSATCTFALNGAATGSYDIVVNNANGASLVQKGAFTVQSGGQPQVWADFVGRSKIRTGVASNYYFTVGNSGTVDAYFVRVWICFPDHLTYTIIGPSDGGLDPPTGYQAFSQAVASADDEGFLYIPVMIPALPAGATTTVQLQLTDPQDDSGINIEVYARLPWFDSYADAQQALQQAMANPSALSHVCSMGPKSYLNNCLGGWIIDNADAALSLIYNQSDADPGMVGDLVDNSPTDATSVNGARLFSAEVAAALLQGVAFASVSKISSPLGSTAGSEHRSVASRDNNVNPILIYLRQVEDEIARKLIGDKYSQTNPIHIMPPPPQLPADPVIDVRPIRNYCDGNRRTIVWVLTYQKPNGTVYVKYLTQHYPCSDKCPVKSSSGPSGSKAALNDAGFPAPRILTASAGCAANPPGMCPNTDANANGGGGGSCGSSGGSIDPNDKVGPTGDQSVSQYVNGIAAVSYFVGFENQATATLPAAQVVVSDQLDPTKVELGTLSLGAITIGNNTINVPSNTTSFNTTFSINSSLSVRIQGSLNPDTGLLKWTFTSIDPSTDLPPSDPTVGFLPPATDGIKGQGGVTFTVMPKSSLTTGTQITNQATVVFDANAPINTPTWLNTLDVNPPSSHVLALPATQALATFTVNWTGTDIGSGIASYNIYVSDNGGMFTLWQNATTAASAIYAGQPGHTYGFYSIATDGAGNVEAAKTSAEASTRVAVTAPSLSITKSHTGVFAPGQQNATYTIIVSNAAGALATSGTVTVTETVPSGLTLVSLGGSGWSCSLNTCSRADPLNGNASYLPITATVNVAANATSPQVNQVSVSGGGSGNASTTDSTLIVAPGASALTITKTHSGSFTSGQQNAAYTITVSNAIGVAPTSGTVTVTELVPAALTLVSMSGTNWTCTSNTCTRSNVLAAGSSYPAITALVNVAPNAASQVTNEVTVSGGGSATANASDLTTITGGTVTTTKPRDFVGNGRSDSLLYDPVTGTAYTALSNGDGTYSYVYNLFTPGFDTLRTGDFNGDGKADLAVYNSQTALAYIGFSKGDGTFAFQSLFWSPGYNIVETGDINNDGKTDVALYNGTTGTLYTGISNGDGTFTYQYHLVSMNFTFIRLADFTGDGKADLFLYNAINGAAYLGVGDGTGNFTFNPLSISSGYNLADIGDLNGDGKMDVILYNGANGNTATGISNGLGGFTFSPLIFSPGFTSVRLANYTGHATADVSVYNKNTAVAYFGTGTGTGTFNFQSLFWSPGYDYVVPEDVNGDGKTDNVLYDSATGTGYTGVSNGDGTFNYTYSYWGIGKLLAR